MKAYHIVDQRIMLRDQQGDLFEFKLVARHARAVVQLVGQPVWKDGTPPRDAEIRIDVASMQARDIARQNGLMS